MNLYQEYQSKLRTPEEAVQVVKSGDWVDYTSYNIVTVIGTAASRVYFHLKAEAVRMRE